MKLMNFVIACLRPSQNMKLGIFTSSRAVRAKKCTKKCDARAKLLFCLFDFLVAAASLSSFYLRHIVMSQKQNILRANSPAPADRIPNVSLTHR